MNFTIVFTLEADAQYKALASADAVRYKKVQKTLGLLETNLRHPSLRTHKYDSLTGAHGEDVFEAYIENNTPGAYRLFFHYGPGRGRITVIAITPHP